MTVQVMAAVLESGLYSGVKYQILMALANHAKPNGYAYLGYATLAEEARTNERHVKRVIKEFALDVSPKAKPKPTAQDRASAPLLLLSRASSAHGTNEYQINVALFERAREALIAKRRERRARRGGRPSDGVTFGDSDPVENAEPGGDIWCKEEKGGVTSGALRGDSRSHRGGDSRSHPYPLTPIETCAREHQKTPPPDWRATRAALKEALGQERYSRDIARLSADGDVVVTEFGLGETEVADTYGVFLKKHGFRAVRGQGGSEVEL